MSHSHQNDGVWVDLGAGYVGPTQDHLLQVANKYNIESYMVNNVGQTVLGLKVFLCSIILLFFSIVDVD